MTDDTQNAKGENGNSKLETGNPELGIRNSEREAGAAVLVEEQPAIDNGQSAIPEPSSMPKEKSNPSIILPLLLEVGCEEIPARFLRDAENGLGERVQAALLQSGLIGPETATRNSRAAEVHTHSTPRRLVVHVPALMAQQPDKVEEILGHPVEVAVDAACRYTRAAESFAQKNSASVDDLARTTTPKGEYLSLRKTTSGRPVAAILAEILPALMTWPARRRRKGSTCRCERRRPADPLPRF